jgi:hypothetical protein
VATSSPRARATGTEARRERRANGDARERNSRSESGSYGDARRAEREASYAKNPDQPIVKHPGAGAAHPHPHAHIHAAHRRVKPVPALLQKRKASEPEKVS